MIQGGIKMDETNFPLNSPIPIEVLASFSDKIDWTYYYARWGTKTIIYSDYYGGGMIPKHLKNKVPHVWIYLSK